jgi:glycosyltransferase involved in cell wall biosynthesis
MAARRHGIPVIAVARGWTGENAKVSLFEALDRLHLRWMDHVVCVSRAQARKVRRAGVARHKVTVIHNAIAADRFAAPNPAYRQGLQNFFATSRSRIVGAAGRLSPEKGFGVLVDAAALIAARDPSIGFVLFGEGPLRAELCRRVAAANLANQFVLAGFRRDLDQFLPFLDLLVLPSFTEGLPNVVLEALAAAVPVVASAVGGTPEVILDGKCGYLVKAGDAKGLAGRMDLLLRSKEQRQAMGRYGQERVARQFNFEAQGRRYRQVFARLGMTCRLPQARRQLAAC